jgi:hypothetical protein
MIGAGGKLTPHVGMAEAMGSQDVWAEMEVARRARMERVLGYFMVTTRSKKATEMILLCLMR